MRVGSDKGKAYLWFCICWCCLIFLWMCIRRQSDKIPGLHWAQCQMEVNRQKWVDCVNQLLHGEMWVVVWRKCSFVYRYGSVLFHDPINEHGEQRYCTSRRKGSFDKCQTSPARRRISASSKQRRVHMRDQSDFGAVSRALWETEPAS